MMKRPQVEVLAPAGSMESMKAGISAGADAIYMGGSRYGARAYADNPEEDRFLEAIDYVHLHGKKIYMTVNTLMKEEELEDLTDYLRPYYERGLDAVIVQDIGAIRKIREVFPDLPVHASTQMTITGPEGAALMTRMGAVRIVTARELSLEEIRRIYQETGVEIESFVHGALCYCYSGQCLFSSLIGGRSGNRGRCAQTCRLPFDVLRRLDENNPNENKKQKKENGVLNPGDSKYVLSLKDLCTLDILPDILVKFRERFPEEQFRIVESDSSTVIEQVASHLVDIGFSGTVIEKANCKYIPFYQDDLVVIMPNTKEYQKIVKEQKDLKWLEGEPLIMREEGSGTRKEAEKQLKKMGISLDDLNIVATIENPEAVKRSVKSGLGITIISRLAAADEIQSGEVLEFPFSQAGSGRNLNLVYNKNYKLPAAAEHVRELIIEKYELQKQSLQ